MAGERRAKSFQCPSCGAPQEIVALGHTKTYACPSCSAVIDMSKPEFEVVLKYQEATKRPAISIGSRAKIKDVLWEVIGYTEKTEGSRQYFWSEYLLFNPYHGFRWLVESEGHWNFGTPIKQQPEIERGMSGLLAKFRGHTYKSYNRGIAINVFILGEFYWEARTGDTATVGDYIDPPLMLSIERTDEEDNWTLLEYMDASEVSKLFKVHVRQSGVGANQTSWAGRNLRPITVASVFAMVMLIAGEWFIGRLQLNKQVASETFSFKQTDAVKVRVLPNIELGGHTSNVEIKSYSPVTNSWIYLDYDLTNEDTGDSYGADSEVSYYEGRDSDGAWTEGSRKTSTIISAVPPGKYSLTIEPELPPGGSADATISIVRDAPYYTNLGFAIFLLCVPPAIVLMMRQSFETRRWGNSDEGNSSGDD